MSGYNASSKSILSFMLSTMSMTGGVRSGHDAFTALPDPLISFILSKLPLKEAVRSCVLSKRWRALYTQMPTFTFPQTTSSDIISKMLLLHSGDLEGFHIDTFWQGYSPDDVCKWVQYASQHNVKHLTLADRASFFARYLEEIPPSSLFSCSSFQLTLRLGYYILTSFPTGFKGFTHLISCYLSIVQMTDDSLTSLLKLCPLLQILEKTDCFGLTHAVISSSTIEHLNINSRDGVQSVLVDYPKFKIMKAFMIEDLRVNDTLFYELSYAVTHLEMYGGDTLSEVQLEFLPESGFLTSWEFPARFLHILGIFQSLQKLTIALVREENKHFPLFELFHRLPNLQMFSMLGLSIQEMAIPVFFTPLHLNLKKISIDIFEFGHKEVEIISCLLQSTPSLEIFEIQQPYEDDEEYDEDQCLIFLENIRFLKRTSLLARIIVLDTMSHPIYVLGSIPTPSLSQ